MQFTTTGQTRKYYVTPTRSSPLKITLVWHDYPAASTVTSYAAINNLDLTAKIGSTSYYANGQSSVSGYNLINNAEQVKKGEPTIPGAPQAQGV